VEAATLLSGLGFESAGLAAAHAVHNGLAAIPATHTRLHGEKVAFGTLVQLMLESRAAGDAAGRVAAVAEARACADFFRRVGLPVGLAELGITAAERAAAIPQIAARAVAAGETIHNMPFRVTAVAVADAIEAADAFATAAT
jgi:glycerol dehydrogenase